ncbi:hypothetical protein [Haloglycomyces albus]|uniref:hypothetical protein n=1 Tax=Haloglycomyces albus TaxID=526067 RepID=UPI00046D95F4|nr:hypothetical protein [Haloglycomyces albus]
MDEHSRHHPPYRISDALPPTRPRRRFDLRRDHNDDAHLSLPLPPTPSHIPGITPHVLRIALGATAIVIILGVILVCRMLTKSS